MFGREEKTPGFRLGTKIPKWEGDLQVRQVLISKVPSRYIAHISLNVTGYSDLFCSPNRPIFDW